MDTTSTINHREPWNKGKLVGQKAPLRPKDIWAIRVRLQMRTACESLLSSISDLTANSGAATSSPCGGETSATVTV